MARDHWTVSAILCVANKMAGSNAGGYECEFVDNLVKDFECPLCLHVTRDPNLTSCCGQHFCQVCINRIQTNHQPCPFCKDTNFTVLLDKKQNRKVLELKVYCTMKEQGYSWTGELGGLSRHLEDCQYVTISCTKGCGVSFQRCCLAAHIAELCPKRDFTCQYCGFKSAYEEVCNKHWPKCAKYPIPCPNKCDIAEVQRGSLEQHLNECPLQQVECEFCHAGCKEKTQRKDLTEHMEKNLQKHLSLLSSFASKKIKRLSSEAAGKNAEIKRLTVDAAENNAEIKRLTTDAAEKEKQINHLQSRVQDLENVILLPQVEFTLRRYSQYENKSIWWKDGPTFYTSPMGHKVKIKLFFGGLFCVALQNVVGKFDDRLQWPLHCTLSLQVLDQLGKHHLQRSVKVQIPRGGSSNMSAIYTYNILKNPANGAQYLKDDSLHFRVDVK